MTKKRGVLDPDVRARNKKIWRAFLQERVLGYDDYKTTMLRVSEKIGVPYDCIQHVVSGNSPPNGIYRD